MNTNTDFDKIDKVLTKNGGGLFSTCWCVGQAIREPDLDWRKIEKDLQAVRGNEACDGSFSYCG